MKHLLCHQNRFNTNTRFVFRARPGNESSRDAADQAREMLLGKERTPERERDERELRSDTANVQKHTLAQEIEQNNILTEGGDATQYMETFAQSPKLNLVYSMMESGMQNGGPDSNYNYDTWTAHPKRAAQLFNCGNFMPRGPGHDQFIRGLYQEPPSAQSMQVLTFVIDKMNEKFRLQREAKAAMEKEANTPTLGHSMQGRLNNVMKYWNNASGGEQAVMGIVGIGAVIALWKNRDKDILGLGIKEKDLAIWGTIFAGANILSGAVSYDGKTFLNRLGTGVEAGVDDLDSKFIKGYACKLGMDEDKTKLKAFQVAMNFDVRYLYETYRQESKRNVTKHEMPARALNLADGQINGEGLYDIMDKLVMKTAENQMKYELMVEHHLTDPTKIDPVELNSRRDELTRPENKGKNWDLFKDKYGNGGKQTLLQAVVNEYSNEEEELIQRAEQHEKDTMVGMAQGKYRGAMESIKKWGKEDLVPYVTTQADHFAGWIKRDVAGTIGRKLDNIHPIDFMQEIRAWEVQASVENCFDPKLDFHVDKFQVINVFSEGSGVARVAGLPGFPIEYSHDERDHKWLVVDGIRFDADAKNRTVNNAANRKLEALVNKKANELYSNELAKYPLLAKDTSGAPNKVHWDPSAKKWKLKDIKVPAYGENGRTFDNGSAEAEMFVNKEGKTDFKINGREIKEFEGHVEQNVFESKLEKTIAADVRLKGLEGLKVKVTGVTTDPTLTFGNSYVVEATIAGLKVRIVPDQARDEANLANIRFLSDTGSKEGLTALKILPTNGGKEFLAAKDDQILRSPEFGGAMLDLETTIDSTDESVLDRLKNGPAGPIKNHKWHYLLDFKKQEAVAVYNDILMRSGNAGSMQDAYKNAFKALTDQTHELSRKIKNASEEDRKSHFKLYMDQLESSGYSNEDFKDTIFEEYRRMIKQFDAPGSESWENIRTPSERYEIYQALLWIFSVNTRAYQHEDPDAGNTGRRDITLSVASKTKLRVEVIGKIENKLKAITAKGDGKLLLENMGSFSSAKQAKDWLSVEEVPGLTRSPWSVED